MTINSDHIEFMMWDNECKLNRVLVEECNWSLVDDETINKIATILMDNKETKTQIKFRFYVI